ncbi:MAG: hypothetical protein K1X78_14740 [Verrucomicrobiaceae bacterium]|nr:hypothetical protein [Verrucomicrobiaceae bacterium]
MPYRRPDSFDIPIPKLTMRERVKIIDPKEVRARKLRQAALVIVLGLCAVAYVRRDYLQKHIAGRFGIDLRSLSGWNAEPARQTGGRQGAIVAPKQTTTPKLQAEEVVETDPDAPVALGSLKLDPVEFPAEKSWPRLVALQGNPTVEIMQEDADADRFIYRSPHYEFQSDTRLGADVVREFARVFEATHMAVCKLPLDLRPAPENLRERFTARIFRSDQAYREAGGMEGSAGCYKRAEKCVLVPLDSLGVKVLQGGRTIMDRGGAANATLIHEITHQMMNHWLPRLPVWYAEGAAEYMVVGDYLHGRFSFGQIESLLQQYLSRRRAPGGSLRVLPPGELMALEPADWSRTLAGDHNASRQNYISALLLTFYFHHLDGDGSGSGIVPYLRSIENGEPERDACRDHLVRGRTMDVLQSDMKAAYQSIRINISFEPRGGPVWKEHPGHAARSETSAPDKAVSEG